MAGSRGLYSSWCLTISSCGYVCSPSYGGISSYSINLSLNVFEIRLIYDVKLLPSIIFEVHYLMNPYWCLSFRLFNNPIIDSYRDNWNSLCSSLFSVRRTSLERLSTYLSPIFASFVFSIHKYLVSLSLLCMSLHNHIIIGWHEKYSNTILTSLWIILIEIINLYNVDNNIYSIKLR